MIKGIIFLITMSLLSFSLMSLQKSGDEGNEINGYYNTFNDYKSNKLQKMDEGLGTMHIMNTIYIRFKKGGKAQKVKCKDIWGLMFKNQLFRIDHNQYEDDPCAVISAGKIVYYENGGNHIDMLLHPEDYKHSVRVNAESGHMYYFSKNLNSPLFSVSNPKQYNEFKQSNNREYKELFECIDGADPSVTVFKDCAEKYNKEHPAEKSK